MTLRGFGRSSVQIPERVVGGSAGLAHDAGLFRRVAPQGSHEVGEPTILGQPSVYAEFVLGDAEDE